MSTDTTEPCRQNQNWEQRQKHASFFQTQIFSTQQIYLAETASYTILLTVAFAIASYFIDAQISQGIMITTGVILWFILMKESKNRLIKSIFRIKYKYINEHLSIFPGFKPYKLEIYIELPMVKSMLKKLKAEDNF